MRQHLTASKLPSKPMDELVIVVAFARFVDNSDLTAIINREGVDCMALLRWKDCCMPWTAGLRAMVTWCEKHLGSKWETVLDTLLSQHCWSLTQLVEEPFASIVKEHLTNTNLALTPLDELA